MAQGMHLLENGPPIYSDIAGPAKLVQNYRVAQTKLAGINIRTIYAIHTIIVVLFDFPSFYFALRFMNPIVTLIAIFLLLIDIFLLVTMCTNNIRSMKYVEVFSHLTAIFHIMAIFGAISLFFLKGFFLAVVRSAMESERPGESSNFYNSTLRDFNEIGNVFLFLIIVYLVANACSLCIRVFVSEKIIEDLIEKKNVIALPTHV